MLKALLKKQFLELNSYYFQNRKTGKNRGKAGTAAFIALFVVLFIVLGGAFFTLAVSLAGPLQSVGLGWLYFALMGLIALALGIFGSVFNTYAGLYHAKDNELLLSMPIPPAKLLLVRMTGVYAMSLLYEALVFVPTVIAWWITVPKLTALTVVLDVLLVFLLALVILTLTCALGWVVALISGKLKNKSFITVIFSLLFIVVYYFVYFRLTTFFGEILAFAESAAAALRRWAYPVYAFGRAGEGNLLGFLAFTVLALALFALCWLLMSRSFTRITTAGSSEKKAEYKETAAKAATVPSALLKRELLHFKSSPTYMMNCGLGVVLLPVAAVVLLIKAESLRETLVQLVAEMPKVPEFLPVIAAGVIGPISSLNCVTAPSVSLEGKSIWIVQSLPVEPWTVLQAKEKMHTIICCIPALIAGVAVCIALKLDFAVSIYVVALSLLFVMLSGDFGLMMNLLKPNLTWTSEVIPVKQGISVLLALFGGWFLAAAMVGVFFLVHKFLSAENYLIICIVVSALAVRLMRAWLRKRGSEIFANLTV